MTLSTLNVFYGTIVHSISINQLEIISNALIVVDNDKGVIVSFEREVDDVEKFLEKLDRPYKVCNILHKRNKIDIFFSPTNSFINSSIQ